METHGDVNLNFYLFIYMIDRAEYNLSARNTFHINAVCRRFIEIENVDEAKEILPSVSAGPLLVIGGGSNLLLTKDFSGVVVRSGIRGMSSANDGQDILLRCGSGEKWDDVAAYAVSRKLYGTENLSFIPGDAGASAVQNIGAYGAEIKDILHCVEAVEIATGRQFTIMKEECGYAYRYSRFKGEWRGRFFITHVTYRLSNVFRPQLSYNGIQQALKSENIANPTAGQLRNVIIRIRQAKLPDTDVLGNAGSFFTNPVVARETAEKLLISYPDMPVYNVNEEKVKLSAGWMIDRCGWKGKAIGRAAVYEKQALVIVNKGNATGEEIMALCKAVQKDVKDKFGVDIIPEVNIV